MSIHVSLAQSSTPAFTHMGKEGQNKVHMVKENLHKKKFYGKGSP